MQKYISITNSLDIRYFDDGVVVDEWIKIDNYRLMTAQEIKKHETPKPSDFHTLWDGENWIDTRTEDEIKEFERSLFPNLTKRKFQLYMLDHGLLDDVENAINAIEDPIQMRRMQIEYSSSDDFERKSPAVNYMCGLLGWNNEQVDIMWQEALTL